MSKDWTPIVMLVTWSLVAFFLAMIILGGCHV